ncbi:uncharacterized protein LOC769646 isoform X1 [Gallus gallus]|uniref:uncharacterized protein LOC769646 isoform X1 n=1 Tax=Gallus gallus TaxID=9031 RepID=UPI000D64010F|nr:uncharacterized protein LOC769646 isoform X1 [Gallus gallus]XP_040540708.2 uncharacterized protein LOC769646 isoform X1 [Gallus gallus]|eukprot:XP_001231862.3 uncharacterized protein LOC769646 isoform X1 [Gallus gallus]
MALTLCYVLLTFLTLLLLSWGSETLKSQVVLVTVGESVSMECPFHKYNGTSNPFYEILWSHRNESRRVLQFRMTRSNQSCVYDSKGRFSGVLDFGRSVSFLNISAVLMNDTGLYLCYVKIGINNPTKKAIHLLVRGLHPWAAPGDLSYSAPQGSKVTLDCDFPTNLTGNFTDLFWLHKRDQSPPRLIAWHLKSGFQIENGSIGSRFQSSLDLENHWSRLTITGLEAKDGGWYQCQRGLGELSGGQRGRGTNLTVKGSSSALIMFLRSAVFAVIAPCLYLLYRCRVQLMRRNTLADRLHPHCEPSETTGRETTSREAIYVSTGSTEYSLLTFPGRNPAAGDVGQR